MNDPFLLDNEQIEALAEPHLIRIGLQHSIDSRVTALDRHETGLWAEVEDAATGDMLQVEIRAEADGSLRPSAPVPSPCQMSRIRAFTPCGPVQLSP